MNKICTDLSQSKKLIELGVDRKSSDMYYWCGEDLRIGGYKAQCEEFDIPAWSFTSLLGLIPDKISINNESYYLSFTKTSVEFRGPITWDGQKAKSFKMDNILDAAFQMVCWLKTEKYI